MELQGAKWLAGKDGKVENLKAKLENENLTLCSLIRERKVLASNFRTVRVWDPECIPELMRQAIPYEWKKGRRPIALSWWDPSDLRIRLTPRIGSHWMRLVAKFEWDSITPEITELELVGLKRAEKCDSVWLDVGSARLETHEPGSARLGDSTTISTFGRTCTIQCNALVIEIWFNAKLF